MTEAEEDRIGDTLWRAIDFHRSGRRGLSQKTAFILRGLSEGHLSNEYPWILNDGFIASSRASVSFEVLANGPNSVWEVSSEEEEVEPERRVKPKGSVARLEILRSQGAKFLGHNRRFYRRRNQKLTVFLWRQSSLFFHRRPRRQLRLRVQA